MKTYLITLVSRDTGKYQRILVRTDNPDDMQEWLDANFDTLQPPLSITHPVVLGIRELQIRRPVRTVMTTLEKVPAI